MGWEWVGTAATAMVGIAGIGAALWSGSRERSAQNRHALREERRKVYANLFACADRVVAAAKRAEALGGDGGQSERTSQTIELSDLRLALNTAVYELAMSAPSQVVRLAEELRDVLKQKAKAAVSADGSEADITSRHVRAQLLEAMRADLGYTERVRERGARRVAG